MLGTLLAAIVINYYIYRSLAKKWKICRERNSYSGTTILINGCINFGIRIIAWDDNAATSRENIRGGRHFGLEICRVLE